ncbi:hypothetical protein CB0940_06583 [Cercospora beticola]|uniref:BTB domain-containing protein n=1 Tax=Cercospora beticola TaxID=122368 RepID=A0A2G5I0C4_CERBT|nr:hypothetical protein CB0940_06583 [Cercospora beticola]PIA98226.1 hypothetical protein CB0940_06583 [Cercospora beticola]WPA99229.1 hypothetical protein RHO25_003845 [Cercospora beticola]
MAAIHEISSEGDVKLICGSEETGDATHIIVCSAVLRHGSPVFKAMLGAKFKEGHTLATGARLDLPLPDDDAASMLTICQIMHMRPVAPGVQTSEAFLKLAIVVHKYDCKSALAYQIMVWMQGTQLHESDTDRLNLFISAYVLDSAADFYRLGHDVVLHNKSLSVADDVLGIDRMLKKAITALQAHIERVKEHTASQVGTIIKQECTGFAFTNTHYQNCNLCGCFYVSDRSNKFMGKLFESDLWPITSFTKQTLHQMCEGLSSFPTGWSESQVVCGSYCRKHCMKKDQGVLTHMKHIASSIKHEAIKPCLVCVKEGHMQARGICEKGHCN